MNVIETDNQITVEFSNGQSQTLTVKTYGAGIIPAQANDSWANCIFSIGLSIYTRPPAQIAVTATDTGFTMPAKLPPLIQCRHLFTDAQLGGHAYDVLYGYAGQPMFKLRTDYTLNIELWGYNEGDGNVRYAY